MSNEKGRAIARRGLMFVLSSPSGAGKTTLSRRLLTEDPGLEMSVSATTRPMRPGEVDGRDYHFVDKKRFQQMIRSGEFLEHAEVFGHYYGTPKKPVEAALASGRDVLFDIDWQGAQQLTEAARDDLVKVFILPPSVAALEERLKTRAQDSDEVVHARMAKAADEMSHRPEYDYVIVNVDIEDALIQVRAILKAERLKRHRQTGLSDFVRRLREGL
jgi:guanylate kinase